MTNLCLQIPESLNFKVRFALNVIKGGGPKSQFYLMDMGSCWKNNGQPCNGDVTSNVTRYNEMIINANISSWCHPDHLGVCPPYHTFPNGTEIFKDLDQVVEWIVISTSLYRSKWYNKRQYSF